MCRERDVKELWTRGEKGGFEVATGINGGERANMGTVEFP